MATHIKFCQQLRGSFILNLFRKDGFANKHLSRLKRITMGLGYFFLFTMPLFLYFSFSTHKQCVLGQFYTTTLQ
jgi:hypothetical protein